MSDEKFKGFSLCGVSEREIPKLPDTLSLCDDEIKAIFEGKAYDVSLPIQAQLIKEIRLLRETIVRLADEEQERTR